jgi:pilus assembly protein Flp/PilA
MQDLTLPLMATLPGASAWAVREDLLSHRILTPPTASIDRTINMRTYLSSFLRDEQGLTMVEYAVAGGLVTLAAVTAFTTLGTRVTTRITALAAAVLLGGL